MSIGRAGAAKSRGQDALGVAEVVAEWGSDEQAILVGESSDPFDKAQVEADVLVVAGHHSFWFSRGSGGIRQVGKIIGHDPSLPFDEFFPLPFIVVPK